MTQEKFILDACCGGREFWFDKAHPNAIYIDNLPRAAGSNKTRPNWACQPDVIMDFTKLEFPDKSFKLVVWDPPHIKDLCETSIFRVKYGCLQAETWQLDLTRGFAECWRVLADYGVLVFKWSESQIDSDEVLKLFNQKPLFGHRSAGANMQTIWFCFMKIPEAIP